MAMVVAVSSRNDQVLRVETAAVRAPGRPRRLVALGAISACFVRVILARPSARSTAHGRTATPCSARQVAACCASVSSGRAATCAASAAYCRRGDLGGRPGDCPGARLPVARRRWSYRLIVATATWKTRAASGRGIPASTASTTRWRRSTDTLSCRQPTTGATLSQTALVRRYHRTSRANASKWQRHRQVEAGAARTRAATGRVRRAVPWRAAPSPPPRHATAEPSTRVRNATPES